MPVTLFPVNRAVEDIQLFEGSCLEILPTLEAAAYGAVMTSPLIATATITRGLMPLNWRC